MMSGVRPSQVKIISSCLDTKEINELDSIGHAADAQNVIMAVVPRFRLTIKVTNSHDSQG